jgi:hypothetical protein
MKIIVLAFLCLCTSVTLEQSQSQSQELPRRTCRDCVIVRDYNPVKDKARLWLKMLPVADLPDGKMYFSISRDMGEGPAGSKPTDFCTVGISVIAKTAFETNEIEVLILADGKPVSLGTAPLGTTLTTKGEKKSSNFLSVTDWETLSKLGAADKLELHFGGKEIKFDDEQRAAVRDFLAYAQGEN